MRITAQELATGYLGTSPSFSQMKTDRLPNYYYYNGSLQNERSHFIDRHCWDLIRVILLVDPVLDDLLDKKMLTQEQYEHIMEMTTPKKKMIELSEISNKWWHTEKDKLYLSLRDHNYHFIRLMEISDGRSIGITRNHFMDRHQSALIRKITLVNAVLEDLLAQKLVTQDQYNLMLRKETCEEKMVILYEISSSWDDPNKDKLYLSIRKENRSVIRDLEVKNKLESTGALETSSAVSSVEGNKDMRIANNARHAITCSICIDIYTNPVTLLCGHSYCINCITRTWNEQFEGEATCPQCRLRFKKRPDLKKNLNLSEIAECYRSSQSDSKADKRDCTYCTDATMSAVKRCLLCKSFLCDDHLSMHCSPPDYVLLEPTEPLEARKCSIHGKILEYCCIDDSCLICVSCCIGEDHQGHCMKTLNEAAGKKKEKLRSFQEQLNLDMPATWNKIQDLNDWKREMEKNLTQDMFLTGNIKQIVQENGLLRSNSMLKKEDFASILTLLEKMEMKYNEMASKIEHIEKVCHMMDPFMVLNDTESKSADFYNSN